MNVLAVMSGMLLGGVRDARRQKFPKAADTKLKLVIVKAWKCVPSDTLCNSQYNCPCYLLYSSTSVSKRTWNGCTLNLVPPTRSIYLPVDKPQQGTLNLPEQYPKDC